MSHQHEILGINGVSISYGNKVVVSDISLSINSGEMFGLMGLNGAGKTTLIKAVMGLRKQDSGSIKIFGNSPENKAGRVRVAYLPERFEPPWFLTGMEFIKFSFSLYKHEFDKKVVMEGAEKLALDSVVLNNRVQTYSKGMRQKLGLLATILTDCSLLILDEPMSGLDPMARSHVKDALIDCKSHEKTIFLSSHILADMDEICDRVAVINKGSVEYVGTSENLKNKTNVKNLERAFLHLIEKKDMA